MAALQQNPDGTFTLPSGQTVNLSQQGFPQGSVLNDDGSVQLPKGYNGAHGDTWMPGDPIQFAGSGETVGNVPTNGVTTPTTTGTTTDTTGSLIFDTPPPGPGNFQPGAPPQFAPPTYTPPPAFKAPTPEEAANDPGYQFSLNQGEQALQQSAAARGTLNTGGTLKDILNYGQQAATQQYGNVYNRNLQTYQTNYGTQYADPYMHAYQSALDAYMPQFNAWQATTGYGANQSAANQQQAMSIWQELYKHNQDLIKNLYNIQSS